MSGKPDQTDDGKPAKSVDADRETQIQERAYYRWIREGLPEGRDYEYWLQAEKEIDAGQVGEE